MRNATDLLDSLAQGGTRQEVSPPVPEPEPMPELHPELLTMALNAQDRMPERDRATEPGYLHVSSLIHRTCPRQYAILLREERAIYRGVTGGHRVMWKIGRGVEDHIRKQYLRSTGRNNVFGQWACPCGDTLRKGYYAREHRCPTCDKVASIYKELPVFDHEAKIVGNPDMILNVGGWLVVVEIKSMAKDQWETLSKPLGDHVFQAGMYRHLLHLKGHKVHRNIITVYCTKDFKFGSPYKEFQVDVTTNERVALFEDSRDYAKMLAQHAENGTLPPRERCQTTTSKAAQSCPAVASCFNAVGE